VERVLKPRAWPRRPRCGRRRLGLPRRARTGRRRIVGDVLPTVRVHVVRLNAAQEGRNLARRVVVGPDRVVDDRKLEFGRDRRRRPRRPRPPRTTRPDCRRRRIGTGRGGLGEGDLPRRLVHQVNLRRCGLVLGQIELVAAGVPHPERVAVRAGFLLVGLLRNFDTWHGRGDRAASVLELEVRPRAPGAVVGGRAHEHGRVRRVRQRHADEVEGPSVFRDPRAISPVGDGSVGEG